MPIYQCASVFPLILCGGWTATLMSVDDLKYVRDLRCALVVPLLASGELLTLKTGQMWRDCIGARQGQHKRKRERSKRSSKMCSTRPSRVVPHRSTTRARRGLTSLFGWEAVIFA
eukprot:scaffold15834_cov96-Isochrysis_galbana.AAC.3